MRIAVVGGLERKKSRFMEMASASGHILENHDGCTGGSGSDELQRLINRASLVIIQTTVNSHVGVQLSKRMAKRRDKPVVVIPKLGENRFRELIGQIDREPEYFNKNNKIC